MRKRSVIIILAIAVIAVVGYLLSQPRKGTIAYHKAEYLKAKNRLEGNTLTGRFCRLVHRTTGISIYHTSAMADKALRRKLDAHERALLDRGYLMEHQFVITNNFDVVLMNLLTNKLLIPRRNAQHTRIVGTGPPILYVVGRPSDISTWEEAIRKLDVPMFPTLPQNSDKPKG